MQLETDLPQPSVDIERTYGQRKLLAQRTPLFPARRTPGGDVSGSHSRQESADSAISGDIPTPAATDGETATETELDTETETEVVSAPLSHSASPRKRLSKGSKRVASPVPSQHDLLVQYFRQDTILFHNIDLLR